MSQQKWPKITKPPPKVWVSGFPSVNGNRISASTIMKKLKNGCHFINIDCMGKFQITDPPKFGSLVFWVSMETEYQCQPLWKMAAIWLISIIWKNFKLPIPPKFGSPVFQVSTEMEYHCQPLWKNWKMAVISLISIVWKNYKLLTPQNLGLWFSECQWKRNIIGKLEM